MPKDSKEHLSLMDDTRSKAEANFGKPETSPWLPHPDLLNLAKEKPPKDRVPTVSSFEDWVYRLYNDNSNLDGVSKRLAELGESILRDRILEELKIEASRQSARRARIESYRAHLATKAISRFEKPGWEKIYDGTSASNMEIQIITALELDGEPLAARPDLVFQHTGGDVIVIEIKVWQSNLRKNFRKLPPPFGWPNQKVQLWCYGLIEWPKKASKVILRGLVGTWDSKLGLLDGRYVEPWFSTDPRVHKESLGLFEAFGGRYVGGKRH